MARSLEAADAALELVDQGELVGLASDLIRIPSFKGGAETELAYWVEAFFKARGYKVDMQEVEPGRYQTIATLPGRGTGKSLMFNGHLDIDPLRGGWQRNPWEPTVEGDALYGAGARNMKGGLAAMIVAAEAIRRTGVVLNGDLVLACVIGELEGGIGTAHLLESGLRTDMAVLPEPLGADTLITTFAGVVEFAVSTIGFSEHMTRNSAFTIDAIEQMGKAMSALRNMTFSGEKRSDLPDLPMLNIGCIMGGRGRSYDLRGPNYISDYCTVLVDVRFPPGLTSADVIGDIREVLDQVQRENAGFDYELCETIPNGFGTTGCNFEPTEVPTSEYIVQSVARHFASVSGQEATSIGAVVPWSYAAGDTSHLWRAGIPCLFYGPNSPLRVPGDSDDCVSISQMETVAKVLVLTAMDVCNMPK